MLETPAHVERGKCQEDSLALIHHVLASHTWGGIQRIHLHIRSPCTMSIDDRFGHARRSRGMTALISLVGAKLKSFETLTRQVKAEKTLLQMPSDMENVNSAC